MEEGAGEEDALLLVDLLQDLLVEAVERLTFLISRRNVAEGEEGERGLGEELDAGEVPQLFGRLAGQVELLVQGFAEGAEAVHLDGEPDAEAAEGAGQLRGQLAEVGESRVVVEGRHV